MPPRRFGFSEKEYKFLKRLGRPERIQDYLDSIVFKPDIDPNVILSPRNVMKKEVADCVDGGIFAAAALRVLGYPPLIMDLLAYKGKDDDHVIAVFQQKGYWGAIAKSGSSWLTYRNPVYRDPRELAMSYFNSYFNAEKKKTMRGYSDPVDLSMFDHRGWMASNKNISYIRAYLYKMHHHRVVKHPIRPREGDHCKIEPHEFVFKRY